MISKIFKLFGKGVKTAKDKVDDGLDFIDDALEAEYITGTIDKAKELTGKAVQKAGETYERGKMMTEEVLASDVIEQAKQSAESLIDSGKEALEKVNDNQVIKQVTENLKKVGSDIVDGAERLADRAEDFLDDRHEEEE